MPDLGSFHTADIAATDIDKIAIVERRCFQAPWSPASCAAELTAGGGGYVTTCCRSGEIAGYLFYRIILDEMHIMKLATAPSWRNRQIASGLLKNAVALADRKGLRQVCLEVQSSNLPAIHLYTKCGFELSGRRPGYYDNREDAVLMARNLANEGPSAAAGHC